MTEMMHKQSCLYTIHIRSLSPVKMRAQKEALKKPYLILWENFLMTLFHSIIHVQTVNSDVTLTLYSCWEIIVKPLKIRKSSLETFGLMSAFLAFMALGSNSFHCLNSYVKTVHIRQIIMLGTKVVIICKSKV